LWNGLHLRALTAEPGKPTSIAPEAKPPAARHGRRIDVTT